MNDKRKWILISLAAGGLVAALSARRARQTKAMLERYNAAGEKERRSHEPRPGDVLLFYRPGRKRDHIIQFFTDSPFYHAALYAGDGRVIEARPKGIVEDGLHGREHNFVVAPAPEGRGQAALDWARQQLGDPFSGMDMFMNALDRVFIHWDINYTTPGKYTCGEFVATAFDNAGVGLFPGRDRDEIAPADFAKLLPSEARPEVVAPPKQRTGPGNQDGAGDKP